MENIFQAWQQHSQNHTSSFKDEASRSAWLKTQLSTWNQKDYPTGESWKYVNFKDIKNLPLSKSLKYPRLKIMDQNEFYLIDVGPTHDIEKLDNPLKEHFEIAALNSLSFEELQQVQKKLDQHCDLQNPFAQMHLSFLDHCYRLKIKKNTVLNKPIYLRWNNNTEVNNEFSLFHFIVECEENAQAELFLDDKSQGQKSFNSLRLDLFLESRSQFKVYFQKSEADQSYSFYHAHGTLKKEAQLKHFDMTHPSLWTRHNLNFELAESGSEVHLKGAYLNNKNNFSDHHTRMTHHVPQTHSFQDYRGLLDDKAKAVFNGLIQIRHHAFQSQSQLINKNLLLSTHCEINTKPELQIDNDDVKASHGATVGRLDPDQLFYLLSRGLTEKESRQILAKAFIAGLLEEESPLVKKFYGETLNLTLSQFGEVELGL